MANMKIKFDPKDVAEVKRLFASTDKLYNQVAYRAITKVVAGVKTDADAEIRGIYNLKKMKVMAGIHTDTGTRDKPMMQVTVGQQGKESAQPVSLINYGARQVKAGVSVQILKSKPRTAVAHGFIADGRNANRHAFMRRYRYEREGPYIQNSRKTIPYAKLPKKYRSPVYKLTGPRLADAFTGRPQLYKTIKEKALARLKKELNYQYDLAFKSFK